MVVLVAVMVVAHAWQVVLPWHCYGSRRGSNPTGQRG
jgi:hypothetical protein